MRRHGSGSRDHGQRRGGAAGIAAQSRARGPVAAGAIDRARYRTIRRFLVRSLLHAVWWDLVLNRTGLRRFRRSPTERWAGIAARYSELAVRLGGVLIKLGQFLSTRVDLLPPEVTRELADLQDHVPPVPLAEIRTTIEEALGTDIDTSFAWLDSTPVGAASLAQVHAARLHSGEEVVIKVLRPRIHELVATDLAAFRQATRWLRLSRAIQRRVDIAWIEREFTAVTQRELDLEAEGRSIERFASDFANDPSVKVPAVFWSHTAGKVLTMENVAGIKITDIAGLEAAGIWPPAVAKKVYAIYMRQLFETWFVHADPHPGNLFVRPVRRLCSDGACPGEGASGPEPEVEIAFVDFGMVTEIPERLRAALREFAIGLATQDARRCVESYVAAGSLLPGADIERLIEAHEEIFHRLWGVPLGEMRDAAMAEAQGMLSEYRDLLLSAPIQLQADMLFATRAVGLLAGLCTTLDPEFEPWTETIPFAERFAREQSATSIPKLLEELGSGVRGLIRMPSKLDRLMDRIDRGSLGIETSLSGQARRSVERLERAVSRLSWTVAGAALLVSGSILTSTGGSGLAMAPWLLAGAGICGLIALLARP